MKPRYSFRNTLYNVDKRAKSHVQWSATYGTQNVFDDAAEKETLKRIMQYFYFIF